MLSVEKSTTLLLVDDDAVLRQVLSRVLRQEGFDVLSAGGTAEALRLAKNHPPGIALLDLTLPDGNGVELGRELAAHKPGLPMLLMTGDEARLSQFRELQNQFVRVLTKPVMLDELRRAIKAALHREPVSASVEAGPAAAPAAVVRSAEVVAAPASQGQVLRPTSVHSRLPWLRSAAMVFFALLVLAAFLVYALQLPIAGVSSGESEQRTVAPPPPLAVELVEGKSHTIFVPDDVLESLGIGKNGVEPAAAPTHMRPLILSGSTALNPDTLTRFRANFAPAKVVKIGETIDVLATQAKGSTNMRELRPGDKVEKGQVLAEFYSLDVASRKSDLVDALVSLSLDQEVLRRAEASAAVSDIYTESARKQVRADQSAIYRAERQLAALGIPGEDVEEVYKDALQLCRQATESGGKGPYKLTPKALTILRTVGVPEIVAHKLEALQDKEFTSRELFVQEITRLLDKIDIERWRTIILMHASTRDPRMDQQWARVQLKAPLDGILVERNVNLNETVVDNSLNLFQIEARNENEPPRLLVIANADERDLPKLLDLQEQSWTKKHRPAPWKIYTAGGPRDGIGDSHIEDVGRITDPNQHTVPVKGTIDNRDGRIRGGQHVTAHIELPPPEGVVEVPVNAVVDDGKQTMVLVQVPDSSNEFTLRRVQVTHWFDKTVFVKSSFTATEKAWLQDKERRAREDAEGLYTIEPLAEGERVLTAGVLLLKKELQDKESDAGR